MTTNRGHMTALDRLLAECEECNVRLERMGITFRCHIDPAVRARGE